MAGGVLEGAGGDAVVDVLRHVVGAGGVVKAGVVQVGVGVDAGGRGRRVGRAEVVEGT